LTPVTVRDLPIPWHDTAMIDAHVRRADYILITQGHVDRGRLRVFCIMPNKSRASVRAFLPASARFELPLATRTRTFRTGRR